MSYFGSYYGFGGDGGETTISGLTTLPGIGTDDVLTIIRGDDYSYADGHAIVFVKRTGESWEAFADGDVITVTIAIPGTSNEYTATVIEADGEEQSFYIEIDADDFAAFGEGWFDAEHTKASGKKRTLRMGRGIVKRDVTR